MTLYWRDVAERVGVTFVEGFVGAVVVAQMTDQKMWYAAVAAGLASAVALMKGLLAKKVGNADSASLDGGV